jgi:hypothetical protein
MQCQGVPGGVVFCLFNTIQEAIHHLHTAYGDSDTNYASKAIPMNRICQDHGAAPAIWALVSTPILNMLCSAKVGFRLTTLITKKDIWILGFSFVDDTDIIHKQASPQESWEAVVAGTQHSLNTWEG